MDDAVLPRRRGQHGKLYRAESRAHIAVGNAGNVAHGVLVHLHGSLAEAAFPVAERAAHGEDDVVFAERTEFKDAASADDGGGHRNERVFRR